MINNFFEVREFDLITCNKNCENQSSFKYLNEESFMELENFIMSFEPIEDSNAIDFFKIGIRRNVGKVIQARNYVGLIQMKSGFQIQILPKITYKNEEDIKKTFLRMLRSMKDFPSKVFNNANLKMDRMNLYEIFINMYIQEARALTKKGLRSTYLPVEDNIYYFKGKLRVQEHIKKNALHKERFYVTFDEYEVNRPENRLIKSTLLKLLNLSTSTDNIKEIRQLLILFEMVQPSDNYIKDFSKVIIDRNTNYYEILLCWSKVFLLNQSFTTFTGETTARALLFPMEKVFEAYVAKNLKKIILEAGLNWEISTQDKGYYLFNLPEKFALRPDIVITKEDGNIIILDTKWKSLINSPRQNYGISQDDMYQMYAYAKKYCTPEIWLLYPINDDVYNVDKIKFKSNDNVTVNLFFIDVSNIELSLKNLKDIL